MNNSLSRPQLVRVRDGYIAGVAGGLAARMGVSATLVRAAWVVAMLFFGTGFLLYAVMWWVVPHEDRLPLEPAIWVRGRNGMHAPWTRTGVDRKFLGVCGGVARRFDVDPSLVRLLALTAVTLSFGIALAAYLIAAIVMPGPSGQLTPSTKSYDL